MSDFDSRISAAAAARLACFQSLGSVHGDVLAPIIGPALTGGPEWPTRPAYRVIDRPSRSRILASDALANPFEELDRPQTGYGLELYVETRDPEVTGAELHRLPSTWAFGVLADVCTTVARHGGVRALLEELGLLSVETEDGRVPQALRSSSGRAGLLLNVPAPDVPRTVALPGGEVMLVPITLLTPVELAYAVREQEAGRAELGRRLVDAGVHHASDPVRASVVEPPPPPFSAKKRGWS